MVALSAWPIISPSTKATTLFRRRKQANIVDSSGTISFELKTMFLVQNIPRSEGSVCLMRTFELVLTPTRTMEKFPFSKEAVMILLVYAEI